MTKNIYLNKIDLDFQNCYHIRYLHVLPDLPHAFFVVHQKLNQLQQTAQIMDVLQKTVPDILTKLFQDTGCC
jgi:hypothetical protein